MDSAKETTVFVLVPGSFSPASFYDRVVPLLEARGYKAHPTELTSANDGTGAAVSMYQDAQKINTDIIKLADEGKIVVLVCNSYGGIPATEASKGVCLAEREAAGKRGGLATIVYLAAFVAQTGACVRDILDDAMPDKEVSTNGYMSMNPRTDVDYIFLHLSPEDKIKYGKRFKMQSARTLTDCLTFPGYLMVPTTYILCMDDPIIRPVVQRRMVESALEQGAEMQVIEIGSDHCPMISHPQEVVSVLVGVAEKIGR